MNVQEAIVSDFSPNGSCIKIGICVCGKLATGLHELNCKLFNKRVTTETVKRLEHLLSKNGVKNVFKHGS